MDAKFDERLAFGRIAEGAIEAWLIRARGYTILPVYDITARDNKGPRLFTPERALIVPDILAMKNEVRWIEAKHKSHFSWYRKTREWVTGIDLHHYRQYQEVERHTRWPVWLLFLHSRDDSPDGECPTGLFGSPMDYLKQHEHHQSPNWGRSGMVYWAHKTLTKLATIAEVERQPIGNPPEPPALWRPKGGAS